MPTDTTNERQVSQSATTRVLQSLDPPVRDEFGIDVLGCLFDGLNEAKHLVGRDHAFLVITIGLMEFVFRAAQVGIDPMTFGDKQRVGWIGQTGHSRRRYLERRFGAGTVQRVEGAVKEDTAELKPYGVVVLAELAPLLDAIALVNATATSPDPQDWAATPAKGDLTFSELVTSLVVEPEFTDPDEVMVSLDWAPQVRKLLEAHTPDLMRKYDGALYAVNGDSPDAVSQTANSIIELLDRLVRELAPDDDALQWCLEAGDGSLVYQEDDRVLATKRGQFQFIVHMICGTADEAGELRGTIAVAAVQVRNAAQKLKHADRGLQDLPACRRIVQAAEAVLVIFHHFSMLREDVTPELASRVQGLDERLESLGPQRVALVMGDDTPLA